MDPRLLRYYNEELQFLRGMGAEFAREFPKVANRLAIEQFECADPYVERLLEGFSFLAARVQLKLDAEYPRFTQHLIEMLVPGYLAPTPSMAVVQFHPDPEEGALAAGVAIPRQSVLRGLAGRGEQTACEYRTAHEVMLWPIEIVEAQYFRYSGAVAALDVPSLPGVRAGIRIRLRTTGGLRFEDLSLDRLVLHLRGGEGIAMHLYEQILANAVATVVRPARPPAPWREVIDASRIRRVGFEDEEALLPTGHRTFTGYRLLREYFSFPARFLFVELGGLGTAVRRASETSLDVIILLSRGDPALDNVVDASHFALFCTPAVNLFPKRLDRIRLNERDYEYLVVADRTRPMDFEVHTIQEVMGHGVEGARDLEFLPFYALRDRGRFAGGQSYYTTRRQPHIVPGQRAAGRRSNYVGSEVFMMLVDGSEAPHPTSLHQLSVSALCTNRDLPLQMPVGGSRTDFTMAASAPVKAVRCVAGPTWPRESHAEGETAWRLISHLSLNYLTLTDTDDVQGAAALREMLQLYAGAAEDAVERQIEGVKSIGSRPVIRRVPRPGVPAFARGLELTLTLDEAAFEGTGVFLLGVVLEQFFAKYVSINSFTETVVRTVDRGEIVRWPARIGRRHLL